MYVAQKKMSHRQIYEKLKGIFNDGQTQIMSEALIELTEHQGDKSLQQIGELDNKYSRQMDHLSCRITQQTAELNRQISQQDKRIDRIEYRTEKFDERMRLLEQSLHKELYALVWKIIPIVISVLAVFSGAIYFVVNLFISIIKKIEKLSSKDNFIKTWL